MEEPTLLVARNLKSIREDRRLSLDKVAELTGVSKSMLGQIERGDSSPTVATVWKIANGLKVSFTDLLSSPQEDTSVVRKAAVRPLIEDDGRYRLYPVFPIEEGRRFEVYVVEIEPAGYLSAEPHPEGTQEFITALDGELTVRVSEQEYGLAEGDSLRFRADRPHSYRNPGEKLAKISMVIFYAP